ncbi:DUF5980 family protein [Glycomyces paridis]|uniref:Secreted protein n=1 Tax=Glycomyces paridis TaxID=2126555 RepID=A0A4S8PC89_9ACTN|nr:DUF5980 family protein [Glycomyces paridis]THV27321.1 hypothetical protein E9998_15830 [Glycomyces paridis]
MKRSVSRPFKFILALAAGLLMAFSVAAAPAAADQAEATWELADGEQRLCIPAGHPYWSYFVGFISGSWSSTLEAEVTGLPEGTVTSMTTSVPPGDNGDSSVGTIWIAVDLPPLDYGDYPALLTVTDGTSTQTMPILIRAQDAWGC